MATRPGKLRQRRANSGVGLFETLVTALLVTICVAGLLQFTGGVLHCYERNQLETKETLELWNRGRNLRRNRPDSSDTFVPVPGARPLHRFVMRKPHGRQWEVLCAEK